MLCFDFPEEKYQSSSKKLDMEPANKLMRIDTGGTGEFIRQITQQPMPIVSPPGIHSTTVSTGQQQLVPLKSGLTVITRSIQPTKPGRPPLPLKPTVTLSITNKSSAKPEKPPLPSKPTITLSTTINAISKSTFPSTQTPIAQNVLKFKDSSPCIQPAASPNPSLTPFPSSGTLSAMTAEPDSSASVVPSSIQTAILQVLGVVQQIHDTQKLQVQDARRLEEKVDALAKRLSNLEEHVQRVTATLSSTGSIIRSNNVAVKMEKLNSFVEMQKFNLKLGSDSEFFEDVVLWIQNVIGAEDIHTKISKTFDLLFDREFFASSEWQSEPSLQVLLAKFTSLHKLLQAVVGEEFQPPTEGYVLNLCEEKSIDESILS
ncbi:max-binding protein MNT-like [Anopheles coustani]|uniref:max-binding protein MNT-like n=1 Tax=Anopheles coustani TaxID=139045 RepID=UPI002659D525|nr:max-binding protein MNT-like [Anopheles coustani]